MDKEKTQEDLDESEEEVKPKKVSTRGDPIVRFMD